MTGPGTEWQTCRGLRSGRTLPAAVNWPDDQCIVEIDGPEHCEPVKFNADRRGDAQPQLDGYTVPWLTNVRVLHDVQAVVAQIGQFINARRCESGRGIACPMTT